MASQGERVLGVVGMCGSNLESMVQDRIPMQDIPINVQEPPQTDPEPEMGAATAAVYDTSPPPLHQNPPILAESAQPSAPDMAQLCAMLAAMNANMETNTQQMKDKMEEMRGETQSMGIGLKKSLDKLKNEMKKEISTTRAGANELRGSATAVRPALEAGEDRLIRETCRTRLVKVTERVTEREKLNGETETCETRHEVTTAELVIETREVMGDEVIELAETREIEGELDGVKDEHTHRVSEGQWGRAREMSRDPVRAAG